MVSQRILKRYINRLKKLKKIYFCDINGNSRKIICMGNTVETFLFPGEAENPKKAEILYNWVTKMYPFAPIGAALNAVAPESSGRHIVYSEINSDLGEVDGEEIIGNMDDEERTKFLQRVQGVREIHEQIVAPLKNAFSNLTGDEYTSVLKVIGDYPKNTEQ